MARRDRAWLVLACLAYSFSSFLLLSIYEKYFRSHYVVLPQQYDTFDVNNGSIKRRAEAVAWTPPRKAKKTIPRTDRVHVCRLHNKTITLPEAPDVILAGAMKSGTSYFWHLLKEHPDFIPSRKMRFCC